MNFKLTKIKVIISVAIPIILFIIIMQLPVLLNNSPKIIQYYLNMYRFDNILSLGNIFLVIIEILIIYLIWSLIQKK